MNGYKFREVEAPAETLFSPETAVRCVAAGTLAVDGLPTLPPLHQNLVAVNGDENSSVGIRA